MPPPLGNQIDPSIVCKVCDDWHCITVYDPVCYPVRWKPEPESQEEDQAAEADPDFVEIDGYVYLRMWAVGER